MPRKIAEEKIALMVKDYNDGVLSIEEISEKYDVVPRTIYRYIHEYSALLRGRNKIDKDKVKRILDNL